MAVQHLNRPYSQGKSRQSGPEDKSRAEERAGNSQVDPMASSHKLSAAESHCDHISPG